MEKDEANRNNDMKRLSVLLMMLSVMSVLFAAPDMQAIREALSEETMNSTERISYKPIYKEIESILKGEDSPERKVCVELTIEAFIKTDFPFSLKEGSLYDKERCIEDRLSLFKLLILGLSELKSDKELNLKLARRLGEIQPVAKTDGVKENLPKRFNFGAFNLDILSYRTMIFFVFEHMHHALKDQMPAQEFEAFVQDFFKAAKMNEREKSDYIRHVFGSRYVLPTGK